VKQLEVGDDPTRTVLLRALRWWWLGAAIAVVIGLVYFAAAGSAASEVSVERSIWFDTPQAVVAAGNFVAETRELRKKLPERPAKWYRLHARILTQIPASSFKTHRRHGRHSAEGLRHSRRTVHIPGKCLWRQPVAAPIPLYNPTTPNNVALAPGTCLGAYEILSLLGSGGMGECIKPAIRGSAGPSPSKSSLEP
jgi:hypothetical protein